MQKCTVHKAPTFDEIDELVGLNILPANFIELEICYRRDINNNMKTVINKPLNQKQELKEQPY